MWGLWWPASQWLTEKQISSPPSSPLQGTLDVVSAMIKAPYLAVPCEIKTYLLWRQYAPSYNNLNMTLSTLKALRGRARETEVYCPSVGWLAIVLLVLQQQPGLEVHSGMKQWGRGKEKWWQHSHKFQWKQTMWLWKWIHHKKMKTNEAFKMKWGQLHLHTNYCFLLLKKQWIIPFCLTKEWLGDTTFFELEMSLVVSNLSSQL